MRIRSWKLNGWADTTRRILDFVHRHPISTVLLVAFAARLSTIIVLALASVGPVIPDEIQYHMLGQAALEGVVHLLWPGYGQSLYDTTIAFSAPLTFAFKIFGPHLLTGRLLVAGVGVLTAGGVAAVARRAAGPRAGLIAGLLVALLPSQVLWSSTLLRESFVWAPLVTVALVIAFTAKTLDFKVLTALGAGFAGSMWILAHTRDHTFLLALWCAVVAVFVFRPARPVAVRVAVLVLAALLPLTAGLGAGGSGFVYSAAQRLGTTRTQMAIAAESAIVSKEPIGDVTRAFTGALVAQGMSREEAERTVREATDEVQRQAAASSGAEPSGTGPPGVEPPGIEPPSGEPPSAEPPELSSAEMSQRILRHLADHRLGDFSLVVGEENGTIIVDNGLGATLRHMPRGVAAVLMRPLPWEDTDGLGPLLARVENLFWYALYGLALVGAWTWRRRREVVAFPVLSIVALTAVSALTQGNIGTAFRHRGQFLWALALLAALGIEYLIQRRTASTATAEIAREEVSSTSMH